jgi:hypothetical protein
MSVLIADELLQSKLDGADSRYPLQICTPEGKLLGVFIAAKDADKQIAPAISEEELHRRESDLSGNWYSAAEVEQKLREWRCSK